MLFYSQNKLLTKILRRILNVYGDTRVCYGMSGSISYPDIILETNESTDD